MSLKFRLTLFYSLALSLALFCVSILVYGLTQRALYQGIEKQLNNAMNDFLAGESTLDALLRLPNNTYFENVVYFTYLGPPANAVDVRGGILFSDFDKRASRPNPSNVKIWLQLSDADIETLLEKRQVDTRVSLEDGTELITMVRLGTTAVQTNPFQEPVIYHSLALFAMPTNSTQPVLKQLRSALLIACSATFLLFAVMVWLLSQQVLVPLKRVIRAADKVSSQDLSQRVPVPNNRDELRELAETINNMLGRLQTSFETQRRFTADASHELRTPVTAITGHADYLLRRSNPNQTQKDSLEVIKSEAGRMGKLVSDLLELARADAGFTVNRENLNLMDVLEDVHKELAPMAADVPISISSSDLLMEVVGDANRLKQVVLNLTQNALNAGAKQINLMLNHEDKDGKRYVQLEVLDDGPGIPSEAIPHLFERFYRVDGARKGTGSGLGLAIVKWIIEQHEGTIDVRSKVGEGTVFYLLLPAPSNS